MARTALLTTEGHPDVLTLREGGKLDPFDFRVEFPGPYVPRHLTFEIAGRIDAGGEMYGRLNLTRTRFASSCASFATRGARRSPSACSGRSPTRRRARPRQALGGGMPGLPYTLSPRLNPIIREYRRASSAAIDASLKPLMQEHFRAFAHDLQEAGFGGEFSRHVSRRLPACRGHDRATCLLGPFGAVRSAGRRTQLLHRRRHSRRRDRLRRRRDELRCAA